MGVVDSESGAWSSQCLGLLGLDQRLHGLGVQRNFSVRSVADAQSEQRRSHVRQVDLSVAVDVSVDSGGGQLAVDDASLAQAEALQSREHEAAVGEAELSSSIDLGSDAGWVLLEGQLGLESEPALGTSGQVEEDTEGGGAVLVDGSSRSWDLDTKVWVQLVLASLDETEVEETRELGWLDLELGDLGIDGGLDLDFLGDVNVSLVGRIDDLVYRKLRSWPWRSLCRTSAWGRSRCSSWHRTRP